MFIRVATYKGIRERAVMKAATPETIVHADRVEFFQTCMDMHYASALKAADECKVPVDQLYRVYREISRA